MKKKKATKITFNTFGTQTRLDKQEWGTQVKNFRKVLNWQGSLVIYQSCFMSRIFVSAGKKTNVIFVTFRFRSCHITVQCHTKHIVSSCTIRRWSTNPMDFLSVDDQPIQWTSKDIYIYIDRGKFKWKLIFIVNVRTTKTAPRGIFTLNIMHYSEWIKLRCNHVYSLWIGA